MPNHDPLEQLMARILAALQHVAENLNDDADRRKFLADALERSESHIRQEMRKMLAASYEPPQT